MKKTELGKVVSSEDRTFIDMVNHELKSPLVIIKIAAEILQRQYNQLNHSPLIENLEKINSKVDYLTQLINDYTDLVKIQSHHLVFQDQIHNTNSLILNLESKFKQIKIFKPDQTDKSILIDQNRFHQVLNSLINYLPKVSPPNSKIGLSIINKPNRLLFYLYGLKHIPIRHFDFNKNSLWQKKDSDRISTILAATFFSHSKSRFSSFYNPNLGTVFYFDFSTAL